MLESQTNGPFAALLSSLGLDERDAGGKITIIGDDPVVESRHRLGTATAAALAAQGVGIATIWRMRSGRGQNVSVNVHDAVHALNSVRYLRQNGVPIGTTLLPPEPVNGIYRTGDDRHVSIVGPRLRMRNGLLELLDCANTKKAITAAIQKWKASDLETACFERGLVAAMVRTPQEWLAHPQGQILAQTPVVEIEKIGDSAPEPFVPGARPLSGIRSLDVAHILAGPSIARTLAEQGADAVRIATPTEPDILTNHIDTGFGKRAAYLDLTKAADSQRLHDLVKDADVFVQSYSPGSLARRGFSPEQLAVERPGLIYVSVNAWGHSGPWAGYRGFDPESQAVIGMAATEGSMDAPKRLPTMLLNDFLSAFLGTAGVLAALIRRAREGGSYHVKVSLAGTGMWVQNLGLLALNSEGAKPVLNPPKILAMQTPYGLIDYLAPATEFSETLAYWDKPTVPAGASVAQWLPR